MNPELESFLQQAFANLQPTSPAIGRVIVEPDYNASYDDGDAVPLARELADLLRNSSPSIPGELTIPPQYALLARYVRRVSLEKERIEKSWVEIEPPGNWI
jgi:hypothetical protein